MIEKQKRLNDEQAQLLNLLRQNSQEWLIKARLTAFNFEVSNRFELSKSYFEKALCSLKNYDTLFEYASFLRDNRSYSDAYNLVDEIEYVFQQEEASDPNLSIVRRIDIWTFKGNLEFSFVDYQKANANYTKALELSRKNLDLRKEKQDTGFEEMRFRYHVLCLNLAKTSIALRHPSISENLVKTIQYFETSQAQGLSYKAGYGTALHCMGLNYLYFEIKGSAIKYFASALRVYKELAEEDPDKYVSEVVRCIKDLAISSEKQDEVESLYREALELCRKHYQRNPEIMSPVLCNCLNLYTAFLHNVCGKGYEQVFPLTKESLTIIEPLAEKHPKAYLGTLAMVQSQMAALYNAMDQTNDAIEYYKKSHDNYCDLLGDNAIKYEEPAAEAIYRVACTQLLQGNFAETEQSLLIWQKHLSRLKSTIYKYNYNYAWSYYKLSSMFKDNDPNKEKSLQYAKKAIKLFDDPYVSIYEIDELKAQTLAIISYWQNSEKKLDGSKINE